MLNFDSRPKKNTNSAQVERERVLRHTVCQVSRLLLSACLLIPARILCLKVSEK